jgi:hypothetical protein
MAPGMTSVLPPPGYGRRMNVYLAEMYPVPSRLLLALLLYVGLGGLLREVHGVFASRSLFPTLVGISSFFAIGLAVRLMDELKDRALDRALFPDRPLPSGRVLESDITFSLAAVIVVYLAANFWIGTAIWMALAVLGYALLMYGHFFMRRILDKSPGLTLATHQPLFPLLLLYAVALVSAEHGWTVRTLDWSAIILVVFMYWAMFFAVEIARKIRAPEEETAYVTYSKIWGPRAAVLVAAGAQTVSLGIGLHFHYALSLSPAFPSILLAAYAIVWWGYLRFLRNPAPATSKLKPYAEAYLFIVLIAQAVEHGVLA